MTWQTRAPKTFARAEIVIAQLYISVNIPLDTRYTWRDARTGRDVKETSGQGARSDGRRNVNRRDGRERGRISSAPQRLNILACNSEMMPMIDETDRSGTILENTTSVTYNVYLHSPLVPRSSRVASRLDDRAFACKGKSMQREEGTARGS